MKQISRMAKMALAGLALVFADAVVAAPTLNSPYAGQTVNANTQVTFTWNRVSGATSY